MPAAWAPPVLSCQPLQARQSASRAALASGLSTGLCWASAWGWSPVCRKTPCSAKPVGKSMCSACLYNVACQDSLSCMHFIALTCRGPPWQSQQLAGFIREAWQQANLSPQLHHMQQHICWHATKATCSPETEPKQCGACCTASQASNAARSHHQIFRAVGRAAARGDQGS